MATSGKKTYHLIFFAIVIALTVFKWNDFCLPYFWDELGVYARCVDYQVHHGLSLMPRSLPVELSRGHPLLFTCISALVAKIFGWQLFVAHLYAFCISVILLLAVYLKTSKYFNPLTGIISAFILAIQPIFQTQSALLLPEISLALFIFLSLCFYYENNFWLFSLFACFAILTKEPAIILPGVVLFYALLRWFIDKAKPKSLTPVPVILTLVPWLVFGMFLLVQKRQNGWYFFPYHIQSVNYMPYAFIKQIGLYLIFIFNAQGRFLLTLVLLAGIISSSTLNKWRAARISQSFTLLLILFSLAFLSFNSLFNVFLARYITALMVPLAILAAASLGSVSTNRWFVLTSCLALLLVSLRKSEAPGFNYDADKGYKREVSVLEHAVFYVTQIAKPGDKISGNFPAYFALTFPAGGYLNGADTGTLQPTLKDGYYLLVCQPGTDFLFNTTDYQSTFLKSFDNGYAHVRIYKVRRL